MTDDTSAARHTPTPWEIAEMSAKHGLYTNEGGCPIMARNGEQHICVVTCPDPPRKSAYKAKSPERDANARRIVLCVNTHDELLAALKAMIKRIRSRTDLSQYGSLEVWAAQAAKFTSTRKIREDAEATLLALAAIAKAEGLSHLDPEGASQRQSLPSKAGSV